MEIWLLSFWLDHHEHWGSFSRVVSPWGNAYLGEYFFESWSWPQLYCLLWFDHPRAYPLLYQQSITLSKAWGHHKKSDQVDLPLGALLMSNLNSMDWKYFEYAAHPYTSFNWYLAFSLNLLLTWPTNVLDFSRLFLKKALNLSQIMKASWLRCMCILCYYHWFKIQSFRKPVAKSMRLWPNNPAISKWFLYCWQKL